MKNRLEELRKERGIKQEELASAMEVSRQTIGSLENGRYNPSILLAFKLARYFGMSIEEIFIYDIVTANILADVLIPLTPVIVNQMKKGAYYITSGILDVKEEVVVEAVKAAGLTVVEVTHQGEWVSVTARKD